MEVGLGEAGGSEQVKETERVGGEGGGGVRNKRERVWMHVCMWFMLL